MAQSTKSQRTGKSTKPEKPYVGFPLFPHASGRWAKKIRGTLHYFGRWGHKRGSQIVPVEDPAAAAQAAVDLYNEQRDDLHAGRMPRPQGDDRLTLVDLCDLLDSRELTARTFYSYQSACQRLCDEFGKSRLVDDLAPDDFQRYRSKLAKTRGPHPLGNEIQIVRMTFKFGFEQGLLEKPMRFGQMFKKPTRKTVRQARRKNGKRMFEAAQLRRIVRSAGQPLRAMTLLAINCGYGQSDLSSLQQSDLNLEAGWADYPRPKTGIDRRCPLWPETIEAVREAIQNRPKPKDDSDSDLVFVTKYGHRWVKANSRGTSDDAVCKEFAKLLRELNLKRPGLNFYALRHTFETIAGESKDQVAVNSIMGHVDNTMAGVYREQISDERLQAVADTVHAWLWPTNS